MNICQEVIRRVSRNRGADGFRPECPFGRDTRQRVVPECEVTHRVQDKAEIMRFLALVFRFLMNE
jgi:hypothetical protein